MAKSNNSVLHFFSVILNAVGAGVIIALLPNALLGELLKFFKEGNLFLESIYFIVVIIQSFMAFIIGGLSAHQLKFSGTGIMLVASAAMIGSGALQFENGHVVLQGIGDIINIIIVVVVSCALFILLRGRFGSLEMIILPATLPVIGGGIGLLTLPFVSQITQLIGQVINSFTELNPLLMSILIAATFSLLMVTPISLVAIAAAISLTGLGSGAGNLGIVAACVTFIFGSFRVNKLGVNMVLIMGAAKMMIPVYFKHPIIAIPLLINGISAGIVTYIMKIQGTPMSAGFGYSGFIGPINAFNRMAGDPFMNIILLLLAYLVIPFTLGYIVHLCCKKFLPRYSEDIFKYEIKTE